MRSALCACCLVLWACAGDAASTSDGEWPLYGRDAGGSRFSPLAQIDTSNVAALELAWTYRTRETEPEFAAVEETMFEATPVMVGSTLYVSTPLGRVIALHAATGAELWVYDPQVDRTIEFGDYTNRGVSTWFDPEAAPNDPCRLRIFAVAIDGRLIALDGATGTLCAGFGANGVVRLRPSLRIAPFEEAAYQVTSPPVIVGDVVVTGSSIGDNSNLAPASGEVQAFDARTGAPLWRWDPIPRDAADPAFETWRDGSAQTTGAANVWSVMVADPERGLIFAPTSSPAPDYFGGRRLGMNRYGNSVVALRASTGEVVWDFQTVHHDLWDYDNAAPPALAAVTSGGRVVPALLQATKTGMLFVLDRESGRPLLPVEERPVPSSDVPGEEAWPTQPFGVPLSPHRLSADEVWGPTDADREACRAQVAALRNEGIFTPPSLRGSVYLPANIGGAHWGGLAVDATRAIAVVPVNGAAAKIQLLPFESMTEDEADRDEGRTGLEYTHMSGTPYIMRRGFLTSPSGLPCSPPPWGTLVAVDLRSGERLWEVPLGTMAPPGSPPESAAWGSLHLGGPVVTAGGLVFIGATLDRKLRAFAVSSGRELWSAELPAGARATPMTYSAGGRQYVVISAGGGEDFGAGDWVMAFALPEQ